VQRAGHTPRARSRKRAPLRDERRRQERADICAAGRERQLTNLGREFVIRDFDVAPEGSAIIFDDVQESSDIVLADLP
jgi:hypothetical protein